MNPSKNTRNARLPGNASATWVRAQIALSEAQQAVNVAQAALYAALDEMNAVRPATEVEAKPATPTDNAFGDLADLLDEFTK